MMLASLFLILLLAQALPDPKSHESIGWLIAAAGAAVSAVGGVLIFLRRESRMKEPQQERRVHGGPVTVRHEEVYVERHEHADLRADLDKHKQDIWEVVKGLRTAVSRIETSVAETKVLREANAERLTEMNADVKHLSGLVHKLVGIVETKMEAKTK